MRQTPVGRGRVQYEIQVTLRNARGQAAEVQVVQPFEGGWRILQSSLPYKRASATSATWTVKVPASGTATLRFRVEMQKL